MLKPCEGVVRAANLCRVVVHIFTDTDKQGLVYSIS